MPPIEFGHVEIPGPGIGGYKGCGEGGAIGSPPAVINAINDALAPLGVTLTRLPASPAAIVELIEQARGRTTNVELDNEFRVPVPAAKAWEVLTDVERVAPCIPGASCCRVDGDEFTGAVKVKVGPITVSYKGDAAFQEKDAAAQRVVIKANGKETRGNGNAAAVVTAQLKDEGDATTVVITTDLTISGKAAQFGRGVLADVAGNLIASVRQEPGGRPARRRRTPNAGTATAATDSPRPRRRTPATRSICSRWSRVPMAKRFAPVGRRRWPRASRSDSCWGAASASPPARGRRRPAGGPVAAGVMKAAPFAYHRPGLRQGGRRPARRVRR